MELLCFILFFVILRQFFAFSANSQFLNYLIMFAVQFTGLFLPVFITKKVKKEAFLTKNDFKIKPAYAFYGILAGFSLQLLSSLVNLPFLYISEKLGLSFSSNVILPEKSGLFVPYIIVSCLIPAFFEEIFFRKYAYGYLKKYSLWVAVLGSAVIFSALHFEATLFGCELFLGIILAFFVKKGYPLIFTMIVHFFNNLGGFILQLLNENTLYFLNKYFFLFAVFSAFFIIFTLKKQNGAKGD